MAAAYILLCRHQLRQERQFRDRKKPSDYINSMEIVSKFRQYAIFVQVLLHSFYCSECIINLLLKHVQFQVLFKNSNFERIWKGLYFVAQEFNKKYVLNLRDFIIRVSCNILSIFLPLNVYYNFETYDNRDFNLV